LRIRDEKRNGVDTAVMVRGATVVDRDENHNSVDTAVMVRGAAVVEDKRRENFDGDVYCWRGWSWP
jgi:hypothetical protein